MNPNKNEIPLQDSKLGMDIIIAALSAIPDVKFGQGTRDLFPGIPVNTVGLLRNTLGLWRQHASQNDPSLWMPLPFSFQILRFYDDRRSLEGIALRSGFMPEESDPTYWSYGVDINLINETCHYHGVGLYGKKYSSLNYTQNYAGDPTVIVVKLTKNGPRVEKLELTQNIKGLNMSGSIEQYSAGQPIPTRVANSTEMVLSHVLPSDLEREEFFDRVHVAVKNIHSAPAHQTALLPLVSESGDPQRPDIYTQATYATVGKRAPGDPH